MSLAEEIRAFTYEQFVKPALTEMGFANVSCGEVHNAMKFTDRVPAVCSAIGSKIFEAEYGL